MEQYDNVLSLADQDRVINVVGSMMLHLVEGFGNIVAIHDRTSEASDDSVPPVLPHELVVLPSCELSKMTIKQKARLTTSTTRTEQRIDHISTEHKQLQAVYRNDKAVQASIDKCNSGMPFNAAWSMTAIAGRYNALVEFVGDLASISPNSSVVESDFSILKHEKDLYRSSMTDFTVQIILHCKQLATIVTIPF